MTSILLALLLLTNLCIFAIFFVAFRRLQSIHNDFRVFITPEAEGKPSPLGNFVAASADIIARSIVASAKAVFMGVQSGEARANATVDGDIAEGKVGLINPAFGALLNSFPALKKTLRRNPQLVDLAISKLAGTVGKPANNGSSREIEQIKFKL